MMNRSQKNKIYRVLMLSALAVLVAWLCCPNDPLSILTLGAFPAVGLIATFDQKGDSLDYTPGAAVTAGVPTKLADGRVGVPANDIAANRLGALRVSGIFKVAAASGTTWSDGDSLWYDSSASEVVGPGTTLDGSTDFYLGVAVGAKASGDTFGYCDLNKPPQLGRHNPIVFEFDCDGDNGDTDTHILLPAHANPNGAVFYDCFGLVSEVFAGSSEDQGIVTIEDTDGTDLGTITATDAAADVVDDIIRCTNVCVGAADGAAMKTVAAGKGVQGLVTQQTSGGTPAGKFKVYLLLLPLV